MKGSDGPRHEGAFRGRLHGKSAIVTGGARGIGAAIARAFHREGASVLIADVSGAENDLAAQLGDGARPIHVDVSREADVAAMIKTAVDEFGKLDILCNNAGIDGEAAPTDTLSVENFDRVVAVNARSVFLGHKYAIPVMIEQGGGSIINIASIAGLVGLPGLAAYCASKGAVIGLTRVAAVEYGPRNVRCNALCPGAVRTELIEELERTSPAEFAPLKQAALAMSSLGRFAEPEEIAPRQ